MECEFHRISTLQGREQSISFYGTFPPPAYLSPGLQAVDAEIANFATKTQQQWMSVYSRMGEGTCFKKRTIKRARMLLTRRQRLCKQFNTASRFHRALPPEIISLIFEFVVSPWPIDATIASAPVLSDTLRLASVTQQWRSIAVANPHLWSSLRLVHVDAEEEGSLALSLEMLAHFLGRSGAVGLHIHMQIGCGYDNCFEPLLAILRREAPRIRTLRLCVAPYTHMPSDYFASFDFPFPKADVVVIHAATDATDVAALPFVLPCVSQLCIASYALGGYWSYFSTVTHLDMGRLSLYDLRLLLQTASALQVLKVERCQYPSPDLLDLDNTTGDILLRSNGNIVRVQPVVHVGLQSLDIDDAHALWTIILPGLQSLCLWDSHAGIEDFIARSACTLVRFGVARLSVIPSLTALHTVKHVYIDQRYLWPIESFFETLNAYDDTNAHLVHGALGRLESITVRVAYCSLCRSKTDFYTLLPELVAFHRKYGGRLRRFDIHTECCVWVSRDMCNTIPPIHINGYPLEHYLQPSASVSPRGSIGVDRLDWSDRVMLLCLRAKDGLGRALTHTRWRRLFSAARGQESAAQGCDDLGGWGSDT